MTFASENSRHEETRRPLLISLQTAAEMLELSTRKVRQLVDEGEIHSVKIGRSRRIVFASLNDWVKGLGKTDSTPG